MGWGVSVRVGVAPEISSTGKGELSDFQYYGDDELDSHEEIDIYKRSESPLVVRLRTNPVSELEDEGRGFSEELVSFSLDSFD